MKFFTCFIGLVLFGFAAKAQNNDSTVVSILPLVKQFSSDRPGATYSAQTLPKNTWQLQMGGNVGGLIGPKGLDFSTVGFPIDLRYGISNRFEIMLSPALDFATPVGTGSGIEYALSTYTISGRYQLFWGRNYGDAALMGGYQFVSYARGTETGSNGIIKFLYSLPLGNRGFAFSSNVGATFSGYAGHTFDYTINFSGPIFQKLSFFIETYGSHPFEMNDQNMSVSHYDLGISYMVNERFQADAGFDQTLDGSQTYYSFVGMSARF